jgi:hypothetical protein
LLVTFRGNPYIVHPTRTDYQVTYSDVKATFPAPLPPYIPRVSAAPSAASVIRSDPVNLNSAYAGRFTLSLRGLRKDLRQRGGGRAKTLVEDIESAIQSWLDAYTAPVGVSSKTSKAIDRSDPPTIIEVANNPLELVWCTEDPFARWIIHCVSRWHDVVSFSKSPSPFHHTTKVPNVPTGKDVLVTEAGSQQRTQRQTHLLRPNSRHPDPRTTAAIYTPTATDIESSIMEDSDYSNLADSVSSMHLVDASTVPAPDMELSVTSLRIDEEPEESASDAESAFSLIEHPRDTELSPVRHDVGNASSISQTRDEVTRPLRALEQHGVYYQSILSRAQRSDSSPSRSPIRARRHRQMRRAAGTARRSQAGFRSAEPPTTFMAYVYGSSA